MSHILLTASNITYCQVVQLASVFLYYCCLFCNPNSFFFPTGTSRQHFWRQAYMKECQIFSYSPNGAFNTSWKISQAFWAAESGQRQAARLCLTLSSAQRKDTVPDLNHIKLSQKLCVLRQGLEGNGADVMHVFSQIGSWKVPIGLLFWCRSEDIHMLCLLWQLKRVKRVKRSLNLENHTGILQPKT